MLIAIIFFSLLKTRVQWRTVLKTITVYVYTSQVDSVPQEMSLIDLNQVSDHLRGGMIWVSGFGLVHCRVHERLYKCLSQTDKRVHPNRP